jgi:hypothetical protein
MAYVDDDEEIEEAEERGEISQTELEEIYKRYDAKRGINMQRENMYENMDDEAIEKYAENLEKKYQSSYNDYQDEGQPGNIFPSLSDPILWLVK